MPRTTQHMLACLPLLALALAQPALAAPPRPQELGRFNGWGAYRLGDPQSGICYVVADPTPKIVPEPSAHGKKPKPGSKTPPAQAALTSARPNAHLLVTHRPASHQNNVVSIELGVAVAKGGDAGVAIGAAHFSFFTEHATAWTRDAETDKAVVTAMAKGSDLAITVKPASGAVLTDHYRLTGFPRALAAIDKACHVRR